MISKGGNSRHKLRREQEAALSSSSSSLSLSVLISDWIQSLKYLTSTLTAASYRQDSKITYWWIQMDWSFRLWRHYMIVMMLFPLSYHSPRVPRMSVQPGWERPKYWSCACLYPPTRGSCPASSWQDLHCHHRSCPGGHIESEDNHPHQLLTFPLVHVQKFLSFCIISSLTSVLLLLFLHSSMDITSRRLTSAMKSSLTPSSHTKPDVLQLGGNLLISRVHNSPARHHHLQQSSTAALQSCGNLVPCRQGWLGCSSHPHRWC